MNIDPSSPRDADSRAASRTLLETGIWPRWRALFLGYDVFISYRHKDGLGYAMALEHRLRALDLTVFRDARELPAGTPLKESIKRALRRSRMLVVVGTKAAWESESWVSWEMETFAKTARSIIVINIDSAGDVASVLGDKNKIRLWLPEVSVALDPPRPSEHVVQGIEGARTFIGRNRLGRIVLAVFAACLLALAGGVWIASTRAALERQKGDLAREQAEKERRTAMARRLAARSETLRAEQPSMMPESIEAAMEATRLDDSMETDRALRSALALAPPFHHETKLACEPKFVKWSGSTLAVVGSAGLKDMVCVVDLDHRRLTREKELDESPWAADIDGDLLVVSQQKFDSPGSLLIMDAWTGKEQCPRIAGHFRSVSIVPGKPHIVAVDDKGAVVSIDSRSCQAAPLSLGSSSDETRSAEVTFSPKGHYLVATSDKGISVHRWKEDEEPQLVLRQRFAEDDIPFLVEPPFFFDEAEHLLVLASGGTVRGYTLPDGSLSWTLPTGPIAALAMAGNRLLTQDESGRVVTYKSKDFASSDKPISERAERPISGERLDHGVRLSRDGRDVLTYTRTGGRVASTVRLWDRLTGHEAGRLFHDSWVTTVIEGRGDDAYVTVGQDHKVRYWGDVHRDEVEIIVPQDIEAVSVANSRVAIVDGGLCWNCRRLSVWDADTGALVRDVPFGEKALAIQVRDNGDVIVATVQGIWALRSGDFVPDEQARLPFKAVAATFRRNDDSSVFAAIDGHGHGVVYRDEQWSSPGPIEYRNPADPRELDPWGSSGLVLSADAKQMGIALTGAIVFVGLGGASPLSEIRTHYRLHSFAFSPSGDWLSLASELEPGDPTRGPIPALEIVFREPLTRSHAVLASEGYNSAIAVSPKGEAIAVAVGRVLQIRPLPRPGNAPEEISKQIDLPWVVLGLQFGDPGELWAFGSSRVRRLRLDISALESEARDRIGTLLPKQDGERADPRSDASP